MSQPPRYEFAPVTEGLKLGEIGNIFIPDLPRSVAPEILPEMNRLLAATAAEVFLRRSAGEDGLIVGGDSLLQSPTPDKPHDSIWHSLIRQGVPEEAIERTASGVDPVTNFIRGQELFRRNYATGIVTPPGLWPTHRYIAGRTMVRAYGGLLVAGIPDEGTMVHGFDGWASRMVARGMNPRNPDVAKAQKRARTQKRLASALGRQGTRYYGSKAA